jgi:uncharacterized protein YqjF (DUF2071 family)
MIDRLSARQRPAGCPVLHQRWSLLLFLHWRVRPEALRPLVPSRLQLDTFSGEAWIGLTAFRVSRMRPSFAPPLPWLSSADEINLRTYVVGDGVPGLWFFSLDANNAPAVWGARLTYHLPYYFARTQVGAAEDTISFRLRRSDSHAKATPAFDAQWRLGEPLPTAQPGSLDFFLAERYVLFAGSDGKLARARIHHRPWPLRHATLAHLDSTMLSAQGLPDSGDAPLVHAQGQPFDVGIWAPERVQS